MYIGIVRFPIDGSDSNSFLKAAKSYCQRVQSRFRCLAKFDQDYLVIILQNKNSDTILQTIESILKDCEQSGFSRVQDEEIFIESITNILDDSFEESY